MVTYVYRCANCGVFELRTPMGGAPQQPPCPDCGDEGRRLWSSPRLLSRSAATRALDAEARVNDRPAVVAGPHVTTPASPRFTDPRQKRLPRP